MSDTKKYRVLRPIGFNGDRLEKDAIVELTEDEARNIGSDVEPVGAQEEHETSKEESTGPEGSFEDDQSDAEVPDDAEEPEV